MDKIFIRDLALRCIIGCFNEERRKKQDVLIQIEMHCDLRKVGETIAKQILTNKKVKKVVVTIDKPGALRFAKSSAVEITRPYPN